MKRLALGRVAVGFLCLVPLAYSLMHFPGRGARPQAAGSQSTLQARAQSALSTTRGALKLQGLLSPVTVLRDPWGVPHIYAQNQHDLFFAQGFVTAQDRLFQMELWKRVGQGRLAEVLGPNYLQRDINARLL